MAGKGSIVSDNGTYQNNHKDDKEENDLRFTQSYGKSEVPKKKTTFKITSVTKNSQRGGSGDLLSLETDLESTDDLDETVDSHTEDLSSEIFDTNSRATDIDSQDPLLTPEEIVKENEPKEKSARFRVVKVETKEPFKRGRWICCDFLDAPEKMDKSDELSGQPASFGASISLHYVDDPFNNPLLAGATGTASYQRPSAAQDVLSFAYTQGDLFKPIQPVVSSHVGLILDPANQRNSFPGQVGQSSASVPYGGAQHGVPNQSVGHSLVGKIPAGTMPLLTPMQQGETRTSQSLSGNISFPTPDSQFQQLPMPQGSMIPSRGRSQSASIPMSLTSPLQSQVQLQEYVAAQGQVNGNQGQPVPAYQQPMLYQSSQRSGYSLSNSVVNNAPNMGGSVANALPSQNHVPVATPYNGYISDGSQLPVSGMSLGNLQSDGMLEAVPTLGAGLAQIAVGGVTPASPSDIDNEMTEEAASAVAIDNKIEQAMDLVKSHLMYAVREEVEVLKEVIKELMERMHKVEQENLVLRSEANPTTLSRLPPPLPPLQKPLLQEFMSSSNPPPPSSSTS